MSDATIIDGKVFAANLRTDIAARVAKLKAEKGITPGLAVILVGNDPASEVYVKNKAKQTLEVGMNSYEFRLPATITEAELLAKVNELNNDPKVHGILVQLPLPKHLPETLIINSVAPAKDADGFNVVSVGQLATGTPTLIPCTPLGCLMMLKEYFSRTNPTPKPLSGLHAVIIGRSNIVGKPMAQLLLREDCTVTVVHSKTKDVEKLVKMGDIVIAAVGQPELVKRHWLKNGTVVIDVGINRIGQPDGKMKLVGDVDFNDCLGTAGAITPVPGGVGPMTIACLLENTLRAAILSNAN
jgi:methylenetetrahydrofolate dehydrogenase (NADP+)/methenyltetrahydrofolate cyclohydrolase